MIAMSNKPRELHLFLTLHLSFRVRASSNKWAPFSVLKVSLSCNHKITRLESYVIKKYMRLHHRGCHKGYNHQCQWQGTASHFILYASLYVCVCLCKWLKTALKCERAYEVRRRYTFQLGVCIELHTVLILILNLGLFLHRPSNWKSDFPLSWLSIKWYKILTRKELGSVFPPVKQT